MLLFKTTFIKHLFRLSKPAGVFLFLVFCKMASGQKNQTSNILFKPVFGNEALVLDTTYQLPNNNTIQFETFKFYVSNLCFLLNDSVVWKESNSYHLYDATSARAIVLTYPASVTYNAIAFNLGIDSLTTISGALDGDLDPTKGMYWTWQSGYINLKLEGKSSLCANPKKEFQFHLGGYLAPFYALQYIKLPAGKKQTTVIQTDLKKLIDYSDLSKQSAIMSPGADAIKLAKVAANCFSILP